MSNPRLLSCALLCATFISGAQAANGWDESTQGDLSNVGTSPTGVTLGVGSNIIRGTTGRNAGVVDRDYFSFTLPAGWQLDTLNVLPGSSFLGVSGVSFIAVQAGPQVTVSPTSGSATGLLGWTHFGENDLNTDILGLIGIGPGASGFITPLPAGTYAFWIQDTGTGTASYNLDFRVSAVPHPASAWLLAAGLLGLAGRLRAQRRRRSR
jgi:hypothetical protein